LGQNYYYSVKPEIMSQIDEATGKAKTRRLRYVQLVLISPSIVILSIVFLNLFDDSRFLPLEHIYGWIHRASFYGSPILLLYNIVVYIILARRLNQEHSWIETLMMAVVIVASMLLFLAVVFLMLDMRGGDMMPVPEP